MFQRFKNVQIDLRNQDEMPAYLAYQKYKIKVIIFLNNKINDQEII
jgi:hypothetical protein